MLVIIFVLAVFSSSIFAGYCAFFGLLANNVGSGGGKNDNTPHYTINPFYSQNSSDAVWRGFGTSLSWWGALVGGSALEETYADLFFTQKWVTITTADGAQHVLPGLGLNIIRYNIGGTGILGDAPGYAEYYRGNSTIPQPSEWLYQIQGYWKNWSSSDPSSSSWDWNRDANQRSLMTRARDRGVQHIQFFSKAPMWWMTKEHTSIGGSLDSNNIANFATYVATVVDYAMTNWGVNVSTVDIMNWPSEEPDSASDFYESLSVPSSVRVQLLQSLRKELLSRGRSSVGISGVNEKFIETAINTTGSVINDLDQVSVSGYISNQIQTSTADYYVQNLYSMSLKEAVGSKPLCMSEYSDADLGGMALAQAISANIKFLRPSAWIYWQAIDINAGLLTYGTLSQNSSDPDRGRVYSVPTKYFVAAQYTRFILPGDEILATDDDNTVLAYDRSSNMYKFVTVNYSVGLFITINLIGVDKDLPSSVTITYTTTDGSANFATFTNSIKDNKLTYWASPNTVYSVAI